MGRTIDRLMGRDRPAPASQSRPNIKFAKLAQAMPSPQTSTSSKAAKNAKATLGTQVPAAISNLIDAKVAAGEFRSRSDFTLSAVRHYLEHLERKKCQR